MMWNYLSISKLQQLHCWTLGMDKQFHFTLYWECDYLSMLRFKLAHVNRGPWYHVRRVEFKQWRQRYAYIYLYWRTLAVLACWQGTDTTQFISKVCTWFVMLYQLWDCGGSFNLSRCLIGCSWGVGYLHLLSNFLFFSGWCLMFLL